jgi:hypothetical protein
MPFTMTMVSKPLALGKFELLHTVTLCKSATQSVINVIADLQV